MATNVEVHTSISTTSHLGSAMKYCQGKPHYTHGGKVTKRAMFNYGINCPDDPKQALKVMTHTQKMGNYRKNGIHDIREIKTFIGIDPHNPADVRLATKINTDLMKIEHPNCQINSTAQCDGKSGLFHFHNHISPTNPITLKSVTHNQTSCNRAIVISKHYMNNLKPTKHHTFNVNHGLNIHAKTRTFLSKSGNIRQHISYINDKPVKRIRHNNFKQSWMNQLGNKLDDAINNSVSKDDYVDHLKDNGVNVERWHMKTNKRTGKRELHYYKTAGRHPNQSKLITSGKYKGYYIHEKKHYTYSTIINGHKYIARDKKFGAYYNPNNISSIFHQNLAIRKQQVHQLDTTSKPTISYNTINNDNQVKQAHTEPKYHSSIVKHNHHKSSPKVQNSPNNTKLIKHGNIALIHSGKIHLINYKEKSFKIVPTKLKSQSYTQHYYHDLGGHPKDAYNASTQSTIGKITRNSHIINHRGHIYHGFKLQPVHFIGHSYVLSHTKPIMPSRPFLIDLSQFCKASEQEQAEEKNVDQEFSYLQSMDKYEQSNEAYLSDVDTKRNVKSKDLALKKEIETRHHSGPTWSF